MDMKSERLNSLGEILWKDYHTAIQKYASGWLESGYLSGDDVRELRGIENDVERLLHANFDFVKFATSMGAAFIPPDFALPDDEAGLMDPEEVSGRGGQPFRTGDAIEIAERNPAPAVFSETVEIDRQDLHPFPADYNREVPGSDDSAGKEWPELTGPGNTLESLIRSYFDFEDWKETLISGVLPRELIPQADEIAPPASDLPVSESQSPESREFYSTLKGLKDFADLVEAQPGSAGLQMFGSSQQPESYRESGEPRPSMPVSPDKEIDGVTLSTVAETSGRKWESGSRFQEAGTSGQLSFVSTDQSPGDAREPETPELEPVTRAAGMSEIDLDEILEALAQKIHREYKRFYGS